MSEKRYRCPSCGWVGTEQDMQADFVPASDGDEMWSNWICPKCETWWSLENYEVVAEVEG
jgi:rubredoxin